MALVLKDRVKETTTTTGTGTVTLAGAATGFQSFSVIGNANTTYYTIALQNGSEWEVGIGTYTASGTTLSRDTVLESSNSGSLVNFSAGTKDVFVTYPAENAVFASDNPGTSGQYLMSNGTGVAPTWETLSTGDVFGPASSTDNAIARFDGTTGKLIQNSAVTIGDTGNTVISVTDNSNAALRITQLGTGNALLVEDSANPDSTPFVIDASGTVLVGSTTSITNGVVATTPVLQEHGLTNNSSSIGLTNWSSITSRTPTINFNKSAGNAVGTRGALTTSGTGVGVISFTGDDGTSWLEAARIEVLIDGTPGTNDMPGRLVFYTTADGASSPTERFRITSAGGVSFGSTGTAYGTSGQVLQSNGNAPPSWTTITAGDVSGPASATDNAIARYDGTTGKLIQNSAVTIDDTTGSMTFGSGDVDFKTSASNSQFALKISPSGTATTGQTTIFNRPDTANAGYINIGTSNTSCFLYASKTGTGTSLPINISTDGTLALTIRTDKGVEFKGAIDETVYAVVDAAGVALSPSNGTIQTWTLGASRTPTAGTWNEGESMTLMINDGTAYTVTWTSLAVTWVGGSSPTLATSGYTVVELWKVSTTIYGALVGSVA